MGNPHARKVSPERSRTAAQTETPFCKFSLRLQAKPQAKRWMRICEEVHSLGGLPTQALAKTHRLVMDSYPPKSWPQLIPSPKSPKPGPGERRLRRKPSLTLAPSEPGISHLPHPAPIKVGAGLCPPPLGPPFLNRFHAFLSSLSWLPHIGGPCASTRKGCRPLLPQRRVLRVLPFVDLPPTRSSALCQQPPMCAAVQMPT